MNDFMTNKITHRRVLTIAVPILISNSTIPILGAVDTAVIGQLGDPSALGAVGIGAIIITAIYWIFGFLRMGTVGLTSQAFGAKDNAEVDAMLGRCLIIGFVAGLIIILVHSIIFKFALYMSPASPEVEGFASSYMGIRIYSAPAAISLFGITGWLIALERTKSILIIQLLMNSLNVFLDILFVSYDEIKVAPLLHLNRMLKFAGFQISSSELTRVLANNSFESLKAREDKYGHKIDGRIPSTDPLAFFSSNRAPLNLQEGEKCKLQAELERQAKLGQIILDKMESGPDDGA